MKRCVRRTVMPCVLALAGMYCLGEGGISPARAGSPSLACSVKTDMLWPPNHKMVKVGLKVTPSGFSGTVTYTLHVYSNEANDTTGSGDPHEGADGSWNGSDPNTLKLRAERSGKVKTGRVYLIIVTATDTSGNTACCCTTVTVPHDQSKKSKSAVTAAAAAAESYCDSHNCKPPSGYSKIL